ncbi:TPA: IS66 family insertion sequence element accessory protein TnpB [Escherichia coli]|nr:IS66 family insertion sequence element accessory protein TnpB [Escherichia coli]
MTVGYPQTNRKIDTGKTLTRWPVFVDHFIQHVLDKNPFSGDLFIFRGRRDDMIKILWADADGLCLFTKRLEEGQFIWPAVSDGKIPITRSQLAMLLDKLDWRQPKTSSLNALTML